MSIESINVLKEAEELCQMAFSCSHALSTRLSMPSFLENKELFDKFIVTDSKTVLVLLQKISNLLNSEISEMCNDEGIGVDEDDGK